MSTWEHIKGYDGMYIITKSGGVISYQNEDFPIELKPMMTGKDGNYPAVRLCKDGGYKDYKVYRLVAEYFIPNPDNLPEVNHIDEDTTNSSWDNLEWCTTEYNINYSQAIKIGQYDMNDNLVKEWKSLSEAGKNGFTIPSISM